MGKGGIHHMYNFVGGQNEASRVGTGGQGGRVGLKRNGSEIRKEFIVQQSGEGGEGEGEGVGGD